MREQGLVRPGDRMAVAVSGGADSVALLRIMLELRAELGIVLAIAHFHHGIRGAEADADQEFVCSLAQEHQIEAYLGKGDAISQARAQRMTVEEAARELRHAFFCQLAQKHNLQRIATAHTADDQAETVLMKFIRGAGSRGIAGIYPMQQLLGASSLLVRPLLTARRKQVEEYLQELGQSWRNDSSNADLRFTRNRARSRLLPLIAQEFNPAIVQSLAHAAEIARAEEEYWKNEIARLLPLLLLPGKPVRGGGRSVATNASASTAINLEALTAYPQAVQRRLLRAVAESLAAPMNFEHVLAIERLLQGAPGSSKTNKEVELPGGYLVKRGFRELRFERSSEEAPQQYSYELSFPGCFPVPELGTSILLEIEDAASSQQNQPRSIHLDLKQPKVVLRPWRAGDRFWPAHMGAEKKVKELLQPLHLSAAERKIWPVLVAGDRILWVRGLHSPPITVTSEEGRSLLVIKEVADVLAEPLAMRSTRP